MPDSTSSGRRLREFRATLPGRGPDRHLSRDHLAYRLGVSTATLKAWEADGIPRADVLRRLHELTGVSLDWLILGVGEPFHSGRAPEGASGLHEMQGEETRADRLTSVEGRVDELLTCQLEQTQLLERMYRMLSGDPVEE